MLILAQERKKTPAKEGFTVPVCFSRSHYFRSFRGWPSVRENNMTAKFAFWNNLRKMRPPITVRTEAYEASDLSVWVTCSLSTRCYYVNVSLDLTTPHLPRTPQAVCKDTRQNE